MDALSSSLSLLFAELTDGPSPDAAYMLNGGDPGLLRSLDGLSAEAASRPSAPGAASIAAHVDHLCYGLDLMNRWNDGEADPWSSADWTASWRRTTVTESEWAALRERLRQTTRCWREALETPRAMSAAGAERRHRQHRASGLSPGRHQANRPIGSGPESRSRDDSLNGTRITRIVRLTGRGSRGYLFGRDCGSRGSRIQSRRVRTALFVTQDPIEADRGKRSSQ